MSKKGQHVVPDGNGWSVRRAGASRASGKFDTQQQAVERAKDIARSQGTELFIHGRDGRIRERNSYGRDTNPPKGLTVSKPSFDTSVFINCPFDKDYAPILQAVLFCIVYLGFVPRLAKERTDSAENRLEKIRELIEQSKYSIHDLSRCQATRKGEFFRLNMPFELGIDYGCRQYFGKGRDKKKILILEEKPYRYQATLSDLSGCDIEHHAGDHQQAVRKVRNWLVSEAGAKPHGAAHILGKYIDFQEWNYEKQLAAGFSDVDIQDYPTRELLEAMIEWMAAGQPI